MGDRVAPEKAVFLDRFPGENHQATGSIIWQEIH